MYVYMLYIRIYIYIYMYTMYKPQPGRLGVAEARLEAALGAGEQERPALAVSLLSSLLLL